MRPFTLPLALSALLLAVSGCVAAEQMARDAVRSSGGPSSGPAGMVTTTEASWSTNAREHRGRSGRFAFDCPANPGGSGGGVWGSGPYTDDSSVCTAGVHAGVITYERGGRVIVGPRPGQNRYAGSDRNGVRTSDYGQYAGSFVVVN